MKSPLSALRSALKDPSLGSLRLEQHVATARQLEDEARADALRLREERPGLLSDDLALAKNREAQRLAAERLEDASLYAGELAKRLEAARFAEEQADRQRIYEQAQAVGAEAEAVLRKDYPRLVRDAHAILRSLAQARLVIEQANAALPAGAPALIDPEYAVRAIPGTPRTIISDAEIEAWRRLDLPHPVDPAFVDEIYETKPGLGKRRGELDACYEMTVFRRVEYVEAESGSHPLALASYLRLPAPRGDGLAYGYVNTMGFDAALSAAASGADHPDAVLQNLAEYEAAPPASASRAPKRTPRIEWTVVRLADTNTRTSRTLEAAE